MTHPKSISRRKWLKASLALSAGIAGGAGIYLSAKSVDQNPSQVSVQSFFEKPRNDERRIHDFKISDIPAYPEIQLVGHWNEQRGHSQYNINPYCNIDLPPNCRVGVDHTMRRQRIEPRWRDEHPLPWESLAYGEYIGPHRTPHVPNYRVRVNDVIDFVFQLTREMSSEPYRLHVGDAIEVISATDPDLTQRNIEILSDGTVSLNLLGSVRAAGKSIPQFQEEVNRLYEDQVNNPAFVIRGVRTNTPLQDIRDSVDARQGQGGQTRQVRVAPDGTVRLPGIPQVHAIGLTLDELEREVNARYRQVVPGIKANPILNQRAPRFVFVLGEVATPGRIELNGPTSVIQAIATAGSWNPGARLNQVVVFRRDCNWRLMATRLDLFAALHGNRPHPRDEIWLRDGDIVLVPKLPIQRIADAVDLYFTRSIYAIMPNQGFSINFDSQSSL